ncbi:MAG TPA: S-layer homology domain-containing protein [Thermoanaerobaculia bacterium]|nr:S-layer homology domain-containing protein [Thermoanaerobaculia bacterium]
MAAKMMNQAVPIENRDGGRVLRGVAVLWVLVLFIGAAFRVLADCSAFGLPFNDLGSTTFCAEIAEAYFSGLTNGTTPTTYAPSNNVTRQQMAAFVTRTLDQSLLRGSRRAALNQWWTSTPHYDQASLGLATVGSGPKLLASDGADLWVANFTDKTVSRIRASDGKSLGTWTGANGAFGVLVAMGKVFVAGAGGTLYMIDPTQAPGAVTNVATLVSVPVGIAFDGNNIWTSNEGAPGSVSIVSPGSTTPWSVNSVSTGFGTLVGIVFDGTHIWVTDQGGTPGKLIKLDSGGAILQQVTMGNGPSYPAFDGHNIWVPNQGDNSLMVVRASDGSILKTFSAGNGNQNGLNNPNQADFDGQRILVTNQNGGLSLFKATDLSIIGNPATPGVTIPFGVCSDGTNFWVSFSSSSAIGRF